MGSKCQQAVSITSLRLYSGAGGRSVMFSLLSITLLGIKA